MFSVVGHVLLVIGAALVIGIEATECSSTAEAAIPISISLGSNLIIMCQSSDCSGEYTLEHLNHNTSQYEIIQQSRSYLVDVTIRTFSDAGYLRCSQKCNNGSSDSPYCYLNIEVPPTTLEWNISESVGPVVNESYSLSCSATGYPVPFLLAEIQPHENCSDSYVYRYTKVDDYTGKALITILRVSMQCVRVYCYSNIIFGHGMLTLNRMLTLNVTTSSDVTVTADPPVDNTLCEDDIITLTCQVSDVTQSSYKWSSTKFNITEQTNSIKIIATTITIQYYCTVFDATTNKSGEGSIVVAKSNISPVLRKTNFENRLDVEEGGSVNLTVEVFSNMSLTAEASWSRLGGLPENAVMTHYAFNGIKYTSLLLTDTITVNTGNYSLTVINECGSSNLYVYIIVREHGDERNAGLIAGLSIIICVGVIGILMMLICGIKCVIHKCLKHQKSYSKDNYGDRNPFIAKRNEIETNCEFQSLLPIQDNENDHELITMSALDHQLADSTTADLENTVTISDHLCESNNIQELIIQASTTESRTIETETLIQNSISSTSSEKIHDLGIQNVEWWFNSTVTCSLNTDISQSVNAVAYSDECLCNPTEVSSIINDVVIISAQSPVDTECLIGGTEVKMFDERGGVFHSYNHGVTVIVPPGAIPSGILAELKFAAMLVACVKFTSVTPVSPIFWLCMEVILQKPIQIRLPQMFMRNRNSRLRFAKSLHSPVKVIEQQMDVLDGGKFNTGQCYASIEVDHFCYYCIVDDKLDPSNIPQNQYLLIAMKQLHLSTGDNWNVHICIVPFIRTCLKCLKRQYNSGEWKHEILQEFSFEDDCNELQIEFSSSSFDNEAKIECLSDKKIKQEDIDFHQYYTNGRLEDLKLRIETKLYPPRRKARVQAKHASFFELSKSIDYQLVCDKKYISGKIIIPSAKDLYEVTSSESDSSLQKKRIASDVGYRSSSDQSSEDSPDESKSVLGELQKETLILRTKKVEHKWFELGIALGVPINKLESIYDKHSDSPVKALVRVYHYWLDDKKGLMPTWKKLVDALQEIDEYSLSAKIENIMNPKQLPPNEEGESGDPEEDLVMKQIPGRLKLLNIRELIPVLNKYGLLTQNENYDLINDQVSCIERATNLVYLILPTKGPEAYGKFIKCIHEETEHAGHRELAKLLPLNP